MDLERVGELWWVWFVAFLATLMIAIRYYNIMRSMNIETLPEPQEMKMVRKVLITSWIATLFFVLFVFAIIMNVLRKTS